MGYIWLIPPSGEEGQGIGEEGLGGERAVLGLSRRIDFKVL